MQYLPAIRDNPPAATRIPVWHIDISVKSRAIGLLSRVIYILII